jgi:hypothetical protein
MLDGVAHLHGFWTPQESSDVQRGQNRKPFELRPAHEIEIETEIMSVLASASETGSRWSRRRRCCRDGAHIRGQTRPGPTSSLTV